MGFFFFRVYRICGLTLGQIDGQRVRMINIDEENLKKNIEAELSENSKRKKGINEMEGIIWNRERNATEKNEEKSKEEIYKIE